MASTGIDQELDRQSVAMDLDGVDYTPEQFPDLVYRIDDPDVVALLFGSGKLVVTGGTDPSDAAAAVDVITDQLADLGLLA